MEWAKIVGIFAGIGIIVVPLAKWLISDWFKKSEQLQRLKAAQTQSALNKLRDDVDKFENAATTLRNRMGVMESHLLLNDAKMANLRSYIETAVQEMQATSVDLKDTVKKLVKSELIELSKQASMMKGKKDGN